jgi:peptidoglycan/LPS O-acetylase OafA/YrhL
MDALLLGGILALVLRGQNSDRWQRSCKWIFLASLATILPMLILHPGTGLDSPLVITVGLTLIATASVGLIGVTLRIGSPAFRVFHLRPLRVIGKYSYGFYIFHMLYQWAWIKFLIYVYSKTHSRALSGIIELASAYIFTFLLAKLSYDLFEVRFLRWKTHFEYDSEVSDHKHAFTTN